jgi:hypothetical protein
MIQKNSDAVWYDEGYRDAIKEKKKEKVPANTFVLVVLSVSLLLDQYWVLAFFVMWNLFEWFEWWDIKKYHESNRPRKWFTDK